MAATADYMIDNRAFLCEKCISQEILASLAPPFPVDKLLEANRHHLPGRMDSIILECSPELVLPHRCHFRRD